MAALPPEASAAIYLDAFIAALHPVFLWAAVHRGDRRSCSPGCCREVPLHGAARAEDIGESFAMPRDATSLEELEQIITRLGRREHRWQTYRPHCQAARL